MRNCVYKTALLGLSKLATAVFFFAQPVGAIDLNIIDWDEVYDSTRWGWRASMTGSLSANFPFGNYYTYVSGGPGFDVSFVIPISHSNGIRVELGYIGPDADSRIIYFPGANIDSAVTSRTRLSVYRGSVTFQIHQAREELCAGIKILRGFAGVGLIVNRWEVRGFNYDPGRTRIFHQEAERKLFFTIGAGATQMVSDHVGFDASSTLDVVLAGAGRNDTPLTKSVDANAGFIFSLRLGLAFFF